MNKAFQMRRRELHFLVRCVVLQATWLLMLTAPVRGEEPDPTKPRSANPPQVTGTPGAPDATTTIDGKQLPGRRRPSLAG